MGWPQYTLIGLWLIGIGLHLARHGEPMMRQDGTPAKWSFPAQVFRVGVWSGLLWAGGFFGG